MKQSSGGTRREDVKACLSLSSPRTPPKDEHRWYKHLLVVRRVTCSLPARQRRSSSRPVAARGAWLARKLRGDCRINTLGGPNF
jgi:hypothetical protein